MYTDITIIFPENRRRTLGSPLPIGKINWKDSDGITQELLLPLQVLKKLNATIGKVHEPTGFKSLIDDTLKDQAFERLVAMYERRDHSCFEYKTRLESEGYPSEVIEYALQKAREYSIVDDVRFAEAFITQKSTYAGWGRKRIELELSRKRVNPSLVEGYPDRFFSFDEDFARAKALLSKKRVPERDPYNKLIRFLISKGFDYQLSSHAVKAFLEQEDTF